MDSHKNVPVVGFFFPNLPSGHLLEPSLVLPMALLLLGFPLTAPWDPHIEITYSFWSCSALTALSALTLTRK